MVLAFFSGEHFENIINKSKTALFDATTVLIDKNNSILSNSNTNNNSNNNYCGKLQLIIEISLWSISSS